MTTELVRKFISDMAERQYTVTFKQKPNPRLNASASDKYDYSTVVIFATDRGMVIEMPYSLFWKLLKRDV